MGLKPVDKQRVPGSSWEWSLRDYQEGTERLNPWIDTKDGSWGLRRDGRQRRQDPEEDREASQKRQDVVLLRLLPEQLPSAPRASPGSRPATSFAWLKSFGEVVELPADPCPGSVRPRCEPRHRRAGSGVPGDRGRACRTAHPAVFIHGPVAVDLEILLRVPALGVGIVKGVQEAGPVHGHLRDATTFLRRDPPAASRMVGTTSMQ